MLNILKNTINRVFASGVDSDASAFITATGLSSTTQKSAITTLVKDLKASGLWSKMKAVYPMVTDNYNLFSYTEDFSNAVWGKSSLTATLTGTYNNSNYFKIADSVNGNSAFLFYFASVTTASTTYTVSANFKKGEYDYVQMHPSGSNGAVFNLANGTIVSSAVTNSTITDIGNGWYKCTITYTASGPNIHFSPNKTSTSTYNYSGTIGSGIYMQSPQIQIGSTATTYQPIATTPSAFMASQMKYNLKDARDLDAAFRLTWSGGWTYSATGATPNGTNAYADTYFNPKTNLSVGSSHQAIYNRVNANDSGFRGVWDGGGATYRLDFAFNSNAFANNCVVWSNGSSLNFSTIANDTGLLQGNSLPNSLTWNRNGSALQTTTTGTTQYPNRNYYLGALNNNGTSAFFSNAGMSFYSLGDGMTSQEIQLFNQIVEKYQVALSRGVQAAQSFYYNSAYSNEANTYLYSTQITGTTQVSAINTLINGLKANNLWTKMKAVYPFVTDYRNLLGYTEDFTNAFWNKYGSTITANTVIAPNGTLTADTLQENTLNTEHHVKTTLNGLIPSETYTYSNYVKYNDRRYMLITVYYNGGIYPNYYATFDILNGVFVSQSGGSGATIIGSSITADNNGWYRITVSGQLGVFSNNIVVQTNLLDDSLAQVYIGTSKSAYVWGAQFETGSTATPYQPVLAANSSSTFMSSQMKFNLVNPQDSDAAFRLAFSGGWTYSTNGAQPNGTNGYADTKFIPSANLTINDQSYSVYSRIDTPAGAKREMGVNNTGEVGVLVKYTGNAFYPIVGNINYPSVSNTDAKGHYISNRTDGTNVKGYKNGSLVLNAAQIPSLISAFSIFIGARNSGVADDYSDRQFAFATIGNGLTDAEALILYNLIQQYQSTLSRQV